MRGGCTCMSRTHPHHGGGTGGHIFPGARGRARSARGAAGTWCGWARAAGMEERARAAAGYPMAWIRVERRARQGTRCRSCCCRRICCSAFWQSARHLPAHPAGRGARPGRLRRVSRRDDGVAARRPLALHEQNAIAGLANRVLASVADQVMVGVSRSALHGSGASGPAIRCATRSLACAAPERASRAAAGRCAILVVGGSLGAQALNERCRGARAAARQRGRGSCTRSGEKHLEASRRTTRRPACRASSSPFIDDMARALRRGRPRDLPRGRGHRSPSSRPAAWRAILVPVSRTPSTITRGQRALPRRARRRDPGAAARADAPETLAALHRLARPREAARRWRRKARALGKPDAARVVRAALHGASPMKHKVQAHPLRRHRRRRA